MPPSGRTAVPSLARRLLPVVALTVALFLVMTGLIDRAGFALTVPAGQAARPAGVALVAASDRTAGISATVGAMPGAQHRTRDPWRSAGGHADTATAVAAEPLPSARGATTRRAGHLLQADVLVVAQRSLPARLVARLRRLGGVAAAVRVDAGRVRVNGVFVNVLGVNPAAFRPFAARPTARSAALWENVTAGGIAISYTMGRQDRLSPAKPVRAVGASPVKLPVAGVGAVGIGAGQGHGLTPLEVANFLAAAKSRLGMPYVWGGAGPTQFDCSGLVQWSLAQAGVIMPRVAADQARTGPLLRLSDLRPGDLLFYHTDPTAPSYISHVAIYIGNGQMIQAPEPGMNVEIVPADFGAGFAGAVRAYPKVAAAVAGNPAG